MFEQFKNALNEYKNWRNPDLPPLEEGEPYALFPEQSSPNVRLRWPNDEWPNSKRAGVYLVLSGDEEVLYVGRANFLGRRLADHFRKAPTGECCSPEGYAWTKPPVYVITIAVPSHQRFEVGSLEEFLIEKFPDSDNIKGKISAA